MSEDDKRPMDKPKPDSAVASNEAQSGFDRNNRGGNNKRQPFKPVPRFKGRIEELSGYVYDKSGSKQSQAEQYIKTTREIANYAGRNFDYGNDIRMTIESGTKISPTKPKKPSIPEGETSLDETDIEIWKEEIKRYVQRREKLNRNIEKLYSVVWGQCSQDIKSEIQANKQYQTVSEEADALILLQIIKSLAHNFVDQKYAVHSLRIAHRAFNNVSQGNDTPNDYYYKFKSCVSVVEEMGGVIGTDTILANYAFKHELANELGTTDQDYEDAPESVQEMAQEAGKELYLATSFILGADRRRYGKLIEDLENGYLMGNNDYPKTLVAAYNLLVNYKQSVVHKNIKERGNDGVSFYQNGDTDNANSNDLFCKYCKEKGHTINDCPKLAAKNAKASDNQQPKETATQLLMSALESGEFDQLPEVGIQFHQDAHVRTNENSQSPLQREQANSMSQPSNKINPWWILLDNQSTCNIFFNKALLKSVHPTNRWLDVHCNAGVRSTNQIGTLRGFGDVWYNPNGIANILSFSKVLEKFDITFHKHPSPRFVIHRDGGETYEFLKSDQGLFYLDTEPILRKQLECTGNPNEPSEILLINTVANNANKYSKRDYSRASLARKLQRIIGRPGTKHFRSIIDNKIIPNCPVNADDIKAADDIFGQDIGILKGRTTHSTTDHVRTSTVTLPHDIIDRYRDVTICADIMKVNGHPFFVTTSRHIKFITGEFITNMQTRTLLTCFSNVRAAYAKRGFRILHAHMDGQFEPLVVPLARLGITANIVSRGEHVPEIERCIRTIKERARSVYTVLPFRHIPRRIIVELIYYSIFWLNSFPAQSGISLKHSPREIITGHTIDYQKHCQLEFGEYVQTHEETDNTMAPRTVGALALRPTGNTQGGHYFLSLTTGRRINRQKYTPLPMPNEVITQVHRLAQSNKSPHGFTITDRNNIPLDDDDDDDDATYLDSDESSITDASSAGVNDDYDDDIEPDNQNLDQNDHLDHNHNHDLQNEATDLQNDLEPDEQQIYNELNANEENTGVQDTASDNNDNTPNEAHTESNNTDDNTNTIEDNTNEAVETTDTQETDPNDNDDDDDSMYEQNNTIGINDVPETDDEEQQLLQETQNETEEDQHPNNKPAEDEEYFDSRWGTRSATNQYNMRPRKRPNYTMAQLENAPITKRLGMALTNIDYTQHNLNTGLKLFKQRGVDAVYKEIKQLDHMDVCEPVSPKYMTPLERKRALNYYMFLKEKRDGKIKARGCADGRSQRAYTPKDETSSPTVAVESLMISCCIDALEGRDVATVDIPGAFMQTKQEGTVHVKLEGVMVDLLLKAKPGKYDKHVQYFKGKPYLYTRLKKALYGTLKGALLFWKNLTNKLKSWGYTINPYDWCVANKNINGKTCTIIWHVDDLKISHEDHSVVSSVIEDLKSEYGKYSDLTINRGKVHDYLGMILDYSQPGKVEIQMKKYIQNILDDLPEDMDGDANTPAANHLFEVTDKPTLLNSEQKDEFHTLVAKLLFLSKRARPDIQTAISFLCTRVQNPDTDDYKKLARVIRYLRKTINITLNLQADNLSIIKWWVDASYATHPDMRSHTGQVMSLGQGAVYSSSSKQKLNTSSSTEAELVGVNDAMTQILWTRYFIEAQGYTVSDNILYQDNESSIRLERNGKASSSKRTRHINIRYFFVTDRIQKQELTVEHCPTESMVADFLTKPLQGVSFRRFRDQIMGSTNMPKNTNPSNGISKDYRSVLEKIEQGMSNNSNSNQENKEMNDVDKIDDEYNESDKENNWIRVSKNRK